MKLADGKCKKQIKEIPLHMLCDSAVELLAPSYYENKNFQSKTE